MSVILNALTLLHPALSAIVSNCCSKKPSTTPNEVNNPAVRFLTQTFCNVFYVHVGKRYIRLWHLHRSRTGRFRRLVVRWKLEDACYCREFLREANSYKRALMLRNSRQMSKHAVHCLTQVLAYNRFPKKRIVCAELFP